MVEIKASLQRRDPTTDHIGMVAYERAVPGDLEFLASELSLNHAVLPSAAEYAARTANNGGVHVVELHDQDNHNPTVNLMTVLAGMVLHIRGDFDRVNLFVPDSASVDEGSTYQAISRISLLARSRERQFTVVCSDADNFTDSTRRTRIENIYRSLFDTASDAHKVAVLPVWVPETAVQTDSTVVAT